VIRFSIALVFLILAASIGASPVPGDVIAPFILRTKQEAPWHWTPGRTTVLTFCAFWCDTWKDQLPRVAQSRRSVSGLPVDFVGVSVDGRWTDQQTQGVGLVLNDLGSAVTSSLQIDRVPYTLVINPKGVVSWAEFGVLRSQELTNAIKRASADVKPKVAYLTFDDFPSQKLSFELLDKLRALHAPATIFCVCSHLQEKPEIAHQIAREGFRPEIHSWDHDRANPQLDRCTQALVALGFPSPTLYRPPGSEKVFKIGGPAIPLSVVDPYDFLHPPSDEICRRILLGVHDGSVIQLHAGVAETLEALPEIVRNLRARGYILRTLDHYKFSIDLNL
jgi:peptidoglycan/xylan/chitin deacetylase (PgdA/CDA1 family)